MNEEKELNYQLEILCLRIQLNEEKKKHLEQMKQYNQLAQEYLDFIRSSNERLATINLNQHKKRGNKHHASNEEDHRAGIQRAY